MFGVSFTEIAVIALITLIFVGPQKLPSMLYTLGRWIRKLRELTTQVRAQTGIDEILRQEGFEGGLGELRSMLRGDIETGARRREYDYEDPYEDAYELDQSREYPPEGADAAGAVPDDLVDDEDDFNEAAAAPDRPAAAEHDPVIEVAPASGPDVAESDPPWKEPSSTAGASPANHEAESKGGGDPPEPGPRA